MIIDLNFKSEEEKKELVDRSEKRFREDLERAVEKARESGAKYISLTGPSCSGKTTACNRLISEFNEEGKTVRVVSIDDFFKNKNNIIKSGKELDLESIESMDLPRFQKYIKDLRSGKKSIKQPIFDMKTASRSGNVEYSPANYGYFLFEGIQVLYPEINTELQRFDCARIYLSVLEDVTLNGVHFDKAEIRFLRRLVRDCKFRGTNPDFVFSYWQTVRNNEIKNIDPYTDDIEIKINSFLDYELCVIKNYVLKLLCELTLTDYKDFADEIKQKFENIPDISEKYIPQDSVFREFIG